MPRGRPTLVRLGDDASSIPRKKGLSPEYFYQYEPVSVIDASDNSRRRIGVVLSSNGDYAAQNGVMTIGIGNGIEVNIPYTDVPNLVSKLIGNYSILDAGDIDETESDSERFPQNQGLLQSSQDAEASKMDRDLHALFVRFKLDSVSTMIADALGVEATSDFHELDEKQILQTSRDLCLKPVNENRLKRMYRSVVAGLEPKLHNGAQSPEENLLVSEQQASTGRQPLVDITKDQFEKALEGLNKGAHKMVVTTNLLNIIQKMNQKTSQMMDPAIAWLAIDCQSRTDPSDQGRSCPENAWLNIPGPIGTPIFSESDEMVESVIHDQTTIEWSASDIENLAKLFLYVCLGEESIDRPCFFTNELWTAVEKIPTGNVEQLLLTLAAWLRIVLFSGPSSVFAAPQNPKKDENPSSMMVSSSKTDSGPEIEKLDAYNKNAQQLAMISKPFTIWHAVGSFASLEGKVSWNVVRMVVRFLVDHNLECPWMVGTKRGVFGETPLHIALLFNAADEKDWRFHEMFSDLWKMCPRLHDAQYEDPLYGGENVLHLAIIRNFKHIVINKILPSDKFSSLLKQRAVGTFFKEPSLSYGYCNLLGESPLFFAACSHQIEIFELLGEHGANLEDTATDTKHNLLHLMIITDSSMSRRAEDEVVKCQLLEQYMKVAQYLSKKGKLAKLEETRNSNGHSPLMLAAAEGSVKMFLHLFDNEKIKQAWTYGALVCKKMYLDDVDVPLSESWKQRDTLSPGSVSNESQFSVLQGVNAEQSADSKTDEGKEPSDNISTMANTSILEIIVLKKRKDILSASQIDKLVEIKWDKYGRLIFYRKLGVTLFVTVAIFLLPMTKIETSLLWKISHTLSHAVTAFVAEYLCENRCSNSLIHRFIFRTWNKSELIASELCSQFCKDIQGWIFYPNLPTLPTLHLKTWTERAKSLRRFRLQLIGLFGPEGLGSWCSVHGACSGALHVCGRCVALGGHSLGVLLDWDSEQRAAQIVPLVSRVLFSLFVLRVCMQSSPASGAADTASVNTSSAGSVEARLTLMGVLAVLSSVLKCVEALLYSVMGLVSFANVVSLTMVFQDCGSFVLMVFKVVSSDLPIFIAIYSIFLLVFAHSHFLASNQLHAGIDEGMNSMWRIFSAMLGNFQNDKELEKLSLSRMIVTGITVTNYFLVAVVLLNLLIAMLTSTYDDNKKDAQQSWKLHRASVLVRIDRSMTKTQRDAPDKIFWQTSPVDAGRRC